MLIVKKKFNYTSHRNGEKHKILANNLAKIPQSQKITNFTTDNENSWHFKVTKAFLQSNIPLFKMNSEPLRKIFTELGNPLPSESKCRQTIETITQLDIEKLHLKFEGQKIFIVTDESDIRGQKFVNTLIGLINEPEKTFLIDCRAIYQNPNAQLIVTIIDDVLKENKIERQNFLLLISDAAKYMVNAGETLKILYPNMFHITCFAHLLHNCAMRVKAHFSDVDNLISSIKSLTVKNKTHRALFKHIGNHPMPIVTRWASWLKASFYYAKNLPEIKKIVSKIDENGIIVEKAKKSLVGSLDKSLLLIVSSYSNLASLVEKTESTRYTIKKAIEDIQNLDFAYDPCHLNTYLNARLESNEMHKINKMANSNLSPEDYANLISCQATSCSVERSFSMLNKLLGKDRNFNPENIKNYIMAIYNKNID